MWDWRAPVEAAADAVGLPVVLYDIPARTGTPIEYDSLVRLSRHERILAVKDAKADLFQGSRVMAETDLGYYSGDDAMNLAWLTHGATGVVSVVGHVAAGRYAEMIQAVLNGQVIQVTPNEGDGWTDMDPSVAITTLVR